MNLCLSFLLITSNLSLILQRLSKRGFPLEISISHSSIGDVLQPEVRLSKWPLQGIVAKFRFKYFKGN